MIKKKIEFQISENYQTFEFFISETNFLISKSRILDIRKSDIKIILYFMYLILENQLFISENKTHIKLYYYSIN